MALEQRVSNLEAWREVQQANEQHILDLIAQQATLSANFIAAINECTARLDRIEALLQDANAQNGTG